MALITPDTIAFRASVSENDLRARIAREVLQSIGALGPDGKPLPDVKVSVKRGNGRQGGYHIEVTGPAPVRMMLSAPDEERG